MGRSTKNKTGSVKAAPTVDENFERAGSASPSESDGEGPEDYQSDMVCPISLEVFVRPALAMDGHVYEHALICACMGAKGATWTSPMTRQPLTDQTLADVPELQARCEAWRRLREARGKEYKLHSDRPELATLSPQIFADFDAFCGDSEKLLTETGVRRASVVVLGMQSHGKSTVLERLIGLPILPRDAKLCTTMAIRVELRRGPAKVAHVVTRMRADNSAVAGTECEVALEVLSAEIKAQMTNAVQIARDAANDPSIEYVIDKEIHVRIQLPYVPSLNLIDLPGFRADLAASNPTMAIARAIVQQEKASAVFLFVCHGGAAASSSMACALIQEFALQSQTLGIFTHIDLVQSTSGRSASAASAVNDLLSPTAPDQQFCGHGWMGVASRGDPDALTQVRGCKEVARLHQLVAIEEETLARIQAETAVDGRGKPRGPPLLLAQHLRRLGMHNVRQAVQYLFEKFIEQHWLPTIHAALVGRFDAQDEISAGIGAAIPNDPDYAPALATLHSVVPKVYPEFPLEKLLPQGNEAFREMLVARLVRVCHDKNDWLRLSAAANVMSLVNGIAADADAATAAWATPNSYLVAAGDASNAIAKVVAKAKALIAALTAIQVGPMLTKMVFTAPTPRTRERFVQVEQQKGFSLRRLLGLGKAATSVERVVEYEKLDDAQQEEISRLGRFKTLQADTQKFWTAGAARNAVKFAEQAQAETAALSDGVRRVFSGDTPNTVCALSWRDQDAVRLFGHRLIELWMRHVVEDLVRQTTEWTALPALREAEAVRRRAVLEEMVKIATLMAALQSLQESMTRALADMPSPGLAA